MRFGFEENIIKEITDVFEKNPKVDKALIFGSRAKGNYRPDSDIDIAIKGYNLSIDDIIKMCSAFEENGIKDKIDLIDYNSIKEKDLTEHIDRVGIEFYKRWNTQSLRNLCTQITDGSHQSPKDAIYDGFPMFSVKDMRDSGFDYSNVKRITKFDFNKLIIQGCQPKIDDILIAKDGSVLKHVFRVKEQPDYVLLSSIAILRPDSQKVNPSFLVYSIKNPNTTDLILSNFLSGSGVPRIVLKDFKEVEINLPPLSDQTAIAEVLSSLDDKIDLLQRQNQTLEKLAETLFKHHLNENRGRWQLRPFGSLIETTFGGEWGRETVEDDFTLQVCCLRGTDIADLINGLAERTPIRFIKEKKYLNIKPQDGDLILEISGGTDDQSTGRTIYINESNRKLFPYPIIFSNFCRLIRPRKSEFTYFLYLYFQFLYELDEFFNLENGSSGIKNLDYKFLLFDLKYPFPSEEQDVISINNQVEVFFKKINKNKHQILSLNKLRDTLLPKLMSGEVRVKI